MKPICAITKVGLLLAALAILPGCATPALWAKKIHRPAESPVLLLASSSDGTDVLVCYNEHCGKSARTHRKAYWLFEHAAHTEKPKPHFVNPAAYDRLAPIPVKAGLQTNSVTVGGYIAMLTEPNATSFLLWRNGQALGSYNLPVYEGAPPASFWRVGLTPVAVATDAAIACVACSGYAAH